MSGAVPRELDWLEQNQQSLVLDLSRVRAQLEAHRNGKTDAPPAVATVRVPGALAKPTALDVVTARFGLSPFERDVVLLCAGIELDSSFAPLCASAQGDHQRAFPTFGLALAALPDAHWSALRPDGPLRAWRLVSVASDVSLTSGQLRIDERLLHFLVGLDILDERLAVVLDPVTSRSTLAPSHESLATRIVHAWMDTAAEGPPPPVQLCGDREEDAVAVASAVCASLRLRLWCLRAAAMPSSAVELDELRRLWRREAELTGCALLVDCSALEPDDAHVQAAMRFIRRLEGFQFVLTRERLAIADRRSVVLDVKRPAPAEQEGVWREALGPDALQLDGALRQVTSQFTLSGEAIYAASFEARARTLDGADLFGAVWEACRTQSRPRLEELAQRIVSAASWDDLVLPDGQRQILRDIGAHVRQRSRVYDEWGFAKLGARGLGINALFAGASGTGKTMAAEVLAHELRLDLYRIDLSAVVSKYIGETEKNLRRIFDAADDGGAILLFDEADALFGKRSEVKDSHDRYANIEVSYLLQRMESYRGLAVLTTNLKSALDPAFLRRLRFVVQFPFPDAEHRAEIWRRVLPQQTPREGVIPERLAQLSVSGGNIRNIALGAAFLAADADEPVRMTHLLRAARSEYAKLEKVLTEAEVVGWG